MRPVILALSISVAGLFACSNNRNIPELVVGPALEKGESFWNKNNDSAFYYFNLVATSATDSLEIATAYTYMGIIQAYGGDQYGGQESLLKSLTYLKGRGEEARSCLSSNYHELGNICLQLKNYEAAITYYQLALKFIRDSDYRTIALNSIALTYQKKGDYDKALELYKSLLAKSTEKTKEYARVLSNFARTQWLKDAGYPAAGELKQALQIRKDSSDDWGLNASYAHLSDYYAVSNPDSALFFAEKRHAVALQLGSPDDEAEALSRLITLSPAGLLKPYFLRYQYLSDSIQAAKNSAKNQFALIRYEAAESKADNLLLQKDNAQKATQLMLQWFIWAMTLLFFIFGGIVLVLRYRRRQQQTEAASRQAIQEHQLKTSQKVHDVVANGLYRIMTDLEYSEAVDKDQLVDKIEVLYERSRDISYESPVVSGLPFHDRIEGLLKSFATDDVRVLILGNGPVIWSFVSPEVQQEVEHILQELMINMKKHSRAQAVLIKFDCLDGHIHMYYTDDGIGLPAQFNTGNGLRNTGNRIAGISGQITFERPERGLKIHIYFPIAPLS